MNKRLPQIVFAVNRLRMIRERVTRETLESAAANMGVSRSYISNLENFRTEPRLSTLITLCGYYGIQVDELFRGCPTSSGRSRIPSAKSLVALAIEHLGLRKAHAQAVVELKLTEELWLAICAAQGKDEDTVVQYRDWILLESGLYPG